MKICYVMTKGQNIHDTRYIQGLEQIGMEVFPIRVGLKTSLFDVISLKKFLRKNKVDVLHGTWITSAGFVASLSGFHPLVISPWGGDVISRPYQNRIYNKIATHTLSHADRILCNSYFLTGKVLNLVYTPEKIRVVPWNVNVSSFKRDVIQREGIREKLGWGARTILIMNRYFDIAYDHKTFVESLPLVLQQNPDVRVVFVGEGKGLLTIKQMVIDKTLEDYVHFVGRVSQDEMIGFLSASDIYVSTSLYDGVSSSLLEAMACELPCVVTNVPSNWEWIKEGVNGYVVPKKNIEELADAVIKMSDDNRKMRQFGLKSYEIVKKSANRDKILEKIKKIYCEVIR